MAEWNKTKVDPSNINGGQEYTKNDNVSLEELNAIVNNSLYASDIADTANTNSQTAINTANSALLQVIEKQGTVVTVGGEAQATFDADTKLDVADGEISVQSINLGASNITENEEGNVTLNGSEIQPKMTAGDGIGINGNVISGQLNFKTVFDANSDDSILNKGYTSGLYGADFSVGIDVSEYNFLLVEANLNYTITNVIVDLNNLQFSCYSGSNTMVIVGDGYRYNKVCEIEVNSEKNLITTTCGYYRDDRVIFEGNNTNYRVNRIIGVK